jgi:VRR-NUC domain
MKSPLPIQPIREMSADDITRAALTLLKLQNVTAWRQTNNAAKRRKGTVKKGVGDIMGYHRETGVMVACEVKKIGDTLKPDQREFLTDLSRAGGTAMVACQVKNQVHLVPFVEYEKK